jgi:hypothetical protein
VTFWSGVVSWVAAAVALAFLLTLVRAGSWRTNRLLVGVLTIEATLLGLIGLGDIWGDDPRGEILFMPTIVLLGLFAWSYLVFIGRLDSPIVRWTRSRAVRIVAGVLAIGAGLVLDARVLYEKSLGPYNGDDDPVVAICVLLVFASVLFASGLALAGSIHAWRRAERGTPARERAGAFALAFGTRDVILASGLLLSELAPADGGALSDAFDTIGDYAFPVATVCYIPLLAYGILKTQLFDIDLKIKLGIQRSTVVTIVAVTSVIAGKIADRYAQAQWGWIAGIAAAVAMLFFTRGLNKVGEKVAETAMPGVQATSAYVAAKKIDVYRAAVETALENDGLIDERERAMLDRLRSKLALTAEDCAAVEAEHAAAGAGA